ncbi:MAG: hypothetical protein HYT81_09885 [Gemmatimonadetes bacterium]|nr:hypothetical protein [Gemmatimonadota bacterium]
MRIAVVGAGTMGHGIAQVAAIAGYQTRLTDADLSAKDAALATNTSSLSIQRIAEVTGRAERVVGMHFFNPVHIMKLVEIVTHQRMARDTAWTVDDPARARELAAMGVDGVCTNRPDVIREALA